MSEIDELRAKASDLGIRVDKRWGVRRLQDAIDEARLSDEDILDIADVAAAEVAEEFRPDEPVETVAADDWPHRIAPCAWLDQDGVRHTDMGLAYEAAQRIRERDA